MDVYVALRDAFDSTRRLLQDYARVRRGDITQHSLQVLGIIESFK